MNWKKGYCQIPDCGYFGSIDVHHIRFRSKGGTNYSYNRLFVCPNHHRLIHIGAIEIIGWQMTTSGFILKTKEVILYA